MIYLIDFLSAGDIVVVFCIVNLVYFLMVSSKGEIVPVVQTRLKQWLRMNESLKSACKNVAAIFNWYMLCFKTNALYPMWIAAKY